MLEQLSKHSLVDLKVLAKGDTHIDLHHTTEDTGIAIGECIKKALRSIRAQTILIPCTQDLYFRPEDNVFEAQHIPNVEFHLFDSPMGHCVANPGNDKNFEDVLDKNIHKLLNEF